MHTAKLSEAYASVHAEIKVFVKPCIYIQGIFSKFRAAFDIGQKGTFLWKRELFKKRAPKIFPTPYSTTFLSVLHQNKPLHNFRKRGQLR